MDIEQSLVALRERIGHLKRENRRLHQENASLAAKASWKQSEQLEKEVARLSLRLQQHGLELY